MTPVVQPLGYRAHGVQRRLVRLVGRDLGEEETVAAAHDRPVVQAQGESETRRDVVQVVRQIAGQPGPELHFLGVHTNLHVVAHAQVQRQAVRDLPVVLQPSGKEVLRHLIVKVGVRDRLAHAHGDRGERRDVPRGGIVPDGEDLLDVGGNGPVGRIDGAGALRTPVDGRRLVDVLAAHLQVVAAPSIEGDAEVVANRVVVLILVLPDRGTDAVAAEADRDRAAAVDRRAREAAAHPAHVRVAGVVVEGETALDLVDGAVAQHLRQRPEQLVAVAALAAGRRRMAGGASGPAERLVEVVVLIAGVEVRLRRELRVEADDALGLPLLRRLVDVEAGKHTGERHRARLALDLVVGEEVRAVAEERAAERPAHLLIRVGDDPVLDVIGGVQAIVPEESRHRAGEGVGARLGDGVGHHPGGAALRGVEAVRDQHELRDRVHAVTGLVLIGARNEVRDLLAVDVDLRVALARLRDVALLVLPAARREDREIHPVAAVDRQLLHLPPVDVAAEGRAHGVDERRVADDGHRFLQRGRRHLQSDNRRLSDEDLDTPAERREALQLRRDAVLPDAHRKPERAPLVGDAEEGVARGFVQGRHRHTGQHAARFIGDGAGERRLLRARRGRCGQRRTQHHETRRSPRARPPP